MIYINYTDQKTKKLINVPEIELTREEFVFEGKWIHLLNPSDREIELIANRLDIEDDIIKSALDEEERSRVEVDDDNTISLLVDLPTLEEENNYNTYGAVPLGMIIKNNTLVTVCLKDSSIIRDFYRGRVRGLNTNKIPKFMFQLLFNISTKYLQYLRQIDKASQRIQSELHKSTKNRELIQLLDLENSLVYFSTSIRGNDRVITKLLKNTILNVSEEDLELLEDVATENMQASEMCTVYRDVLSGTMDAFASVISNNLNIVMKLLTSITILISIPTLIASFLGMNLRVPFGDAKYGFWAIVGISGVSAAIVAYLLKKKKLM